MFSDIERSPSWHSPALTALPPPPHHAAEFQNPHPHPHPSQQPQQQPQYTPSSSSARPPVQSGWFPLQDATQADPSMSRSHDMYSDSMLPPPASRQPLQQHLQHQPQQPQQQWSAADASPYLHVDARQPGHPHQGGHPHRPPVETGGYSTMYSQGGYHTPVQEMSGPPGGFGWQDARPMAPPSIHTTGLDHLRGMPMPGSFDDNYRVHQAAQGMHAMMGMSTVASRYPSMGGYGTPPRKKNHKEISIGRWTSDEHRVFLKGLEMYQGPAWGEIARMIGTRTSTQVRTHAQKFFTKLARSNQMMPHFESQIQKERTRLLSQGAVISAHSSVTPTSTTAHSFTFNTLSPPRKREYPGPRISTGSYDDHSHALRPPMASTSSPYLGPEQSPAFEMYKPRLDMTPPELAGIRKHRLSSGEYGSMTSEQPVTPYGDHTPGMMSYPHPDSYRDQVNYSGVSGGEWNDVASRQWPGAPPVDMPGPPADLTHPGSSNDPDSLPSVNRLLYRGTTSA